MAYSGGAHRAANGQISGRGYTGWIVTAIGSSAAARAAGAVAVLGRCLSRAAVWLTVPPWFSVKDVGQPRARRFARLPRRLC
jgi:hypothetical protein